MNFGTNREKQEKTIRDTTTVTNRLPVLEKPATSSVELRQTIEHEKRIETDIQVKIAKKFRDYFP
jgi:hypothetical protein